MANLDASIGLADDTIIFSDNIQGIERAWNVLCEVFDLSGWKLNKSKTMARFNKPAFNAGNIQRLQALPCWGTGEDKVVWENWKSPFRYLGIQVRLI